MKDTGSRKIRRVKGLLWLALGIGFTVAIARFLGGLGVTTNLSDGTPWGLWVGFDVMGGVALAAGGFVMAAIVYCFRVERLRPLVRPAVLTAFLGYVAVAVGLLFDLGRPWNIWRPMFFWQHHSVLFEVAWCVMLYTTVLALEFLPVPLETSRFHGLVTVLKKATLPLVILGIMLSTLHQSSLGSLFLIAPGRVHPLWYSPILPVLFFVSATGLGMAMVMVESRFISWLYDRPSESGLLKLLARPLASVLLLYAAIRVFDLVIRGHLPDMFTGWEGVLFWFELAVSALLPAALGFSRVVMRSPRALTWTGVLVVSGFVLNRIDVGGVSGITITGAHYFPTWIEFATSFGIVAAAVLAFLFFAESYRVYDEPAGEEGDQPEVLPPSLLAPRMPLAAVRTSSLLFITGVALALALLPEDAVFGARPLHSPVKQARRVLATKVPAREPFGPMLRLVPRRDRATKGWREVLLIDGNRGGRISLFDHQAHVDRQGGIESCSGCHHLNRPNDRDTSCSECHRDEYEPTRLFRHDLHVEALHGNRGCALCHTDAAAPRDRAHTTDCRECHTDMVAGTRLLKAPAKDSAFEAPGYMQAMHGLCRRCHEEEDRKNAEPRPKLGLCGTCHAEPVDLTPLPRGGN